ncbi:hypothetical protein AAFF_G00006010 [Aldrovandia affinis]|uniref:Uncharacterized protein n=1 Tax=Aldrovandia affinis TaxID=143900 RepID=A0AAD7TDV3_9TELE|nr:hypothetical protein AAFF_G00006010 [Aldrovandia affinis]
MEHLPHPSNVPCPQPPGVCDRHERDEQLQPHLTRSVQARQRWGGRKGHPLTWLRGRERDQRDQGRPAGASIAGTNYSPAAPAALQTHQSTGTLRMPQTAFGVRCSSLNQWLKDYISTN